MIDHASFPTLSPYLGTQPVLGQRVYLHPGTQVIGDVVLGDDVSVWPGAVVRGDVNRIRIGPGTNIQDLSVLHVSHRRPADPEGDPLIIGAHVTIGHMVLLHGCQIGDEVLVGMGSVIMDKVVVEDRVMIGAGSLVPPGKRLRSGHLYVGRPAREVRPLNAEELAHLLYSAQHYVRVKDHYLQGSSN